MVMMTIMMMVMKMMKMMMLKNKNDGEDDGVVTVHANACVAPNLWHLKHPETPQELQIPRRPETDQDVPAYTESLCGAPCDRSFFGYVQGTVAAWPVGT